jgi:hypothetical protein
LMEKICTVDPWRKDRQRKEDIAWKQKTPKGKKIQERETTAAADRDSCVGRPQRTVHERHNKLPPPTPMDESGRLETRDPVTEPKPSSLVNYKVPRWTQGPTTVQH